ncbi:MAG TPA: TIGR04222 domain-containing membrane protein [Polyangiaceae bacterium]|nr:TIGR04222 domain-containing membrane protein [Polyangiaceae bacterium]
MLALVALTTLVVGCQASLSDRANGPSYLEGFVLLWLVTVSIAYVGKRLRLRGAPLPVPKLEPYALAQLAGGPATTLGSAVTSLIARGCLELGADGSTLTSRLAVPSNAPAFEREVYERVAATGRLDSRRLRGQAATLTRGLAAELLRLNLTAFQRSFVPLVVALAAPVAGTLRILSRLGSDKPLSILVCLTIAATALAFWAFRPQLERTALGGAALAQARALHEPLCRRASAAELADSGTLPIMFALFGTGAFFGLPASTTALDRWSNDSGSSHFGATCGADSGGSGCSGGGGDGCSGGGGDGCSGGGGDGGSGGCGGCSGGD